MSRRTKSQHTKSQRTSSGSHVVVNGAGFGGISAAAYLTRAGYKVTVYEKNSSVRGRSCVLDRDGFRFDMGPSWYWTPAEHDRWFADMGARREDYYAIHRVDPSYRVYFGDSLPEEQRNEVTVPADFETAKALFESYEPGAELKNMRWLKLFTRYRGRSAATTPAVRTDMNSIDFGLGVWYPEGGLGKVVESMQRVAESNGARFVFTTEVTGIRRSAGGALRVYVRSNCDEDEAYADVVVAGDGVYPYVEAGRLESCSHSLPMKKKRYKRTAAPQLLNYYVGFNRKLPALAHRTFFCDTNWDDHFAEAHSKRCAPDAPLFYLDIPSISDPGCAPEGHEAVRITMLCALGLDDSDELREHYFNIVLDRIGKLTGERLRDAIVFRETLQCPEPGRP